MFVDYCGNGFQFDDNFVKTHEIRLANLGQGSATVDEGVRWFSDRRSALVFKFDRQALLVNRFKKSAPPFRCTPRSRRQ